MPINAFGGGPGSGKTYGVMEHVILPAVSAGRFVLTNIDGLKPDDIYNYVVSNAPAGKIICIGHIRTCSRDEPARPGFFPGDANLDKPDPVPSPDRKTVNGGDLVVIDEATRYWPVGERVSREHQFFFREHRHFSNEVGQTCDLVVIDPDLTQLARPLKGKIEMSSVTRKLKEVGLERYVVDLFRGGKVTGKPYQQRGPYKFVPEIYKLYKSYSHEKAKEQTVDSRQSIFGGTMFKIILPLAFLGVLGGGYAAYSFLTKGKPEQVQAKQQTGQGTATPAPAKPKAPDVSDKWRAAGYVVQSGQVTFYLDDGERRRVFENPMHYKLGRRSYEVKVGESWVTEYSGRSASSSPSQSPFQR